MKSGGWGFRSRTGARAADHGRAHLPWLAAVLLPLAVLPIGCHESRPQPLPSLLLITVDTLRADALGAYAVGQGAARVAAEARSPALDRFAEEATLFERASVPMPLTRPSHFSILTARHPRQHGVLNNQIALPESERTLAEILAEAGYRTGAVVAVRLLGRKSGAEQGFEYFEAPERELEWRAEEVVSRSRSWLEGLPVDQPFFLWVHFFDPHQPYDPPPDHRQGLEPEQEAAFPSLAWPQLMEIAKQNGGNIPATVLEHALGLYRGEVSYTDLWIGKLIGRLDELRPRESAMVVVTADHGECFESGIYFEHSDCLLEGALRVPLLVRYPPTFAAGGRVAEQVSSLDIAPSFLAVAGLQAPEAFSGRPLRERGEVGGASVLVQQPFYQPGVVPARRRRQVVIRRVAGQPVAPLDTTAPKVGIVTDRWKYLRSRKSEELYALAPVAQEETNLVMQETEVRDRMKELLDRALEAWPLNVIEPGEIDPELLQSLRALGYVE